MKYLSILSSIFLISCKNIVITEFNSFKWHRVAIISKNDSIYYKELLTDSFLEFNENNNGFIDFGYKKINFSWDAKNDDIIINEKEIFPKISTRLDLSLDVIDTSIKNVNIILKEGLGINSLNKNKTNFINTSWKWTKYFDPVNGYYTQGLINSLKDKINIDNISLNITENDSEFIFQRKNLNIPNHFFGNRDIIKTFWKENNNILNFLDKQVSTNYFFTNMIFKDNNLMLPMEDSEKNLYYFVFEITKKL